MALVVLHRNLFKNEEFEDAIPGGHSEIDTCHVNQNLVFLSLFVPWNYLLSLFVAEEAISEIYKEFC